MTKKQKPFDAVKMMRKIRTKINKDTANMTFEQLRQYIDERIKKGGLQLSGQ